MTLLIGNLNRPIYFSGKLTIPVKWDDKARANGALQIGVVTRESGKFVKQRPMPTLTGGPDLFGGRDGTVIYDYGNNVTAGREMAEFLRHEGCSFKSDSPDIIPSFTLPAISDAISDYDRPDEISSSISSTDSNPPPGRKWYKLWRGK